MKRLSATSRVSVALVCLTTSILSLALVVGLVPDRDGAVVEGRKALCEQIAVHCSLAAQQGELGLVRACLIAAAHRNPDLLSAAVRSADEKQLLVDSGEHETNWAKGTPGHCSATHMRLPIVLQEKLWGHVELCFRPLGPSGVWAPFRSQALGLLTFVALMGYLAYFIYLRVVLGKQDRLEVIPRRVRTTLNTLAEGVVILDKDERIALANEAFANLVGQRASALQGKKVSELSWTPPHQLEPQASGPLYPWERALGEAAVQTGALLGLQGGPNRAQTLSVNSSPIIADDGSLRGALATFDDLTTIEKKNAHMRKLLLKLQQSRREIRQQNQELKTLATRDSLTGCLNRRAFFAEFETHWSAAERYGTPLSCVMVDVDHFKSVNDTYGHGAGDQVLQQVADTLKTMSRKSDLVCRYGGEEFCVLLPHTDIDEACQAAERFRQGIAARRPANISVTASLGVSAISLRALHQRELLEQADKCLYAAKRGGRNQVVRWDEVPPDQVADKEPSCRGVAPAAETAPVPIPFHAVTALLSALAYRHADTAEHSRRVADLCVATANALLSQGECYVLEVAAMLHDIGKLGVPDAVLLKPGPLNAEEWKVIRTHEGIGDEIIAAAFTSPELSDIIRNHHCWYGGSPHDPDLPRGEAIPVGARILTIADAYDAIVSDRVYRKGRSREEAFVELRRCAGVQFDPALVDRFIAAVQARDDSRRAEALQVSKQTALQIGVQMEKLARALDAQDTRTLATMAAHLGATACANGLTPIAEAAARLERSAAGRSNPIEMTELTIDLLDLCRVTYKSYLHHACCDMPA